MQRQQWHCITSLHVSTLCYSILESFVYSHLEFYAAKFAVDDSKENISPNLDFEQKMAPSLSLGLEEKKPAPSAQMPSSMIVGAPFVQGFHPQPAQLVPHAPNPYTSMPAAPTFQNQYFSAPPPAPHPGYQPGPQAQPAVYYQPQAPPIQYMAPQPMYHPYHQPNHQQPAVSFAAPPPSSGYPTQQPVYYQVPQAGAPAQYTHPYPHQPAAVVHYPFPMQHPPAGGV
jgi:hypothetical protein